MTTVLKLGGSVITDKSEPETVASDQLETLIVTLATEAQTEQLVLVHGGGSFGHYHADKHEITPTDGERDAEDIFAVHDAMCRLNRHVIDVCHDHGLPALPVAPLSNATRDSDGDLTIQTAVIEQLLTEGFIPVLFGDVVSQVSAGATILSGDEIVTSLASSLEADRIGLCSTEPGVYDRQQNVIDKITAYEPIKDAVGSAQQTDVTGGMAMKVRSLLHLETNSHIFDTSQLADFLQGQSVGTTICTEQ